MAGQITPWLTLLGLLPFVVGLLIFFLYILARKWRLRAIERLDDLRARLRGTQFAIRDVQKDIQAFSVEDPEPFGTLIEQLTLGLARCERNLKVRYQLYAGVHSRAHSSNVQHTVWIRSVITWYQLERETLMLQYDLIADEAALSELAQPIDRLRRLGWETASRSREILAMAQLAAEMFGDLSREALIEDSALDSAWQDACEWEETLLAQIPVIYLQDDEQAVVAGGDKETTAHVYRVIKTAEPAVQLLLNKAHSWQSEYVELARMIQLTQRDYNQITNLYHQLQERSLFPIEWERTRASMTRVGEQIAGVGAIVQKRSLDQIHADLLVLEKQLKRIGDLSRQLQADSEQQQKLVKLCDSITLQREEDWLRDAILIAEKVAQYDPANFILEQSASGLKESLNTLSVQWAQFSIADPHQPLRETMLPILVNQAEQIVALQVQLREQSDTLRLQFDEIKIREQELRDHLLRSKALLGQATAVIGSNPFLKRQTKNEAEQLSGLIEKMLLDVDLRAQGTLNEKMKRATPAVKRVEQSLFHWADILEKDLEERLSSLAEKTEVLESKLKLDEPAIADAVRLLRQVDAQPVSKISQHDEDISAGQIERIKTINLSWQGCVINHQKIDEFAGTVLEMYGKTDKFRQAGLERFAKAESMVPETLAWPPTTQQLTQERQQVQTLEQEWLLLQNTPLKAIQMVARLSDFSERYQALERQLARLVDTAQQEQNRIKEFEKRLIESRKMWQRQVEQNSSNRTVQGGVENLLEEIERDYEALKRRYERGLIQYAQALQGIRQICRKIDDAMVPVDGLQEMDINGIVTRRV